MQKNTSNSKPGFVLPNLCADQTLLLLLMAAQLVVITFIVFEFGFHFDWAYFGQVTLYVQWQMVLSVLCLCRLRGYLAQIPKYQAATLAYIILLVVALVIALAVNIWIRHFTWHAVFRNLLLSAIVSGLALRYLYIQQQAIEREKSILQANLNALQAKMRPHFLFNTMNSIASLISFAPEKAEKMVEDLSELLRASLRDNQAQIRLAEEWYLCERYLEIEQLRLGERLQWKADFTEIDKQTLVPSFSLQPLIENAIYHGIQPTKCAGFVEIVAKEQGNFVQIWVKNSQEKDKQKRTQQQGNRIAVENIRLRIAKLYGDSAGLTLTDKGDIFEAYLYYYKNNNEVNG